jgi:hypothetical protein
MASEVVIWRGERWYFYKDYHRNRRGQLLHREVYKAEIGPIPDGYQVHHRDENPRNWQASNLIALSVSDHMLEHEPRGIAAWGFDERSAGVRKGWASKQSTLRECAICGAPFESIGQQAKFCSDRCRAKDFRRRHPLYRERYSRS